MIPALFDAGHCVYAADAEDEWGNQIEQWADPVAKKFVTWNSYATSEPKLAGHDRDVVDAGIIVYPPGSNAPPEMQWFGDPPNPKDRITIDGRTYQVVGEAERNDKAWWNSDVLNWVINLKRVNG